MLTDNPKTKQVTELSVTCFSIQRRGRDSTDEVGEPIPNK